MQIPTAIATFSTELNLFGSIIEFLILKYTPIPSKVKINTPIELPMSPMFSKATSPVP